MKSDLLDDFVSGTSVPNAKMLFASLDEQFQRRSSVKKNIGMILPFAFVRCVDGRDWTEEETESHLSNEFKEMRRGEFRKGRDWLTKGAIACAMTHRSNMIGQITSTGKFCCEDDAILSQSILQHIASDELIELLDGLNGVTLLDYRSRSDIVAEKKPVAKIGKFSIHRVDAKGLGSAACYFVPATIAPKIVKIQTPISIPVDHWSNMISAGAFKNLFLIHPRPASIGDFPTTIGYEYSRNTGIYKLLNKIKTLRRLKLKFQAIRGDFREKVTRWVTELDA